MQLRKRSNVVNYTENGSPPASRLLKRSDSAASLDVPENSDSEKGNSNNRATADRRREAGAEEDEEASSGTEQNSDPNDSDIRLRKRKRALMAKSSRKNHGARKARQDGDVLVYRKRNAENADQVATNQADQDDAKEGVVFIADDDDDFVKVKPKKRKIPAEPSSNRSLRARRTETAVNYKDATSSDEEDEELSSKVKSRLKDHDEDDEDQEDEDDEAEEDDVRESPRRSSYRNGKMRRVAAPSTDSADSLPGNADADDVKCYSRRLKSEEDRGPDSTAADDRKLFSGEEEPVAAAKELMSKPFPYTVDKYGLKDSDNDYGPISKRVTRVEKVLAVRNRASRAPIYCVKLPGKSYRRVMNVNEEQLTKYCPLLLRSFLKRMDALGRVDGHPGDIAESSAFSPKHLKIDRIIAVEKQKRWTHYYVKWCGLSYSESTWEKEEDLTGEGDAIKRYKIFNRRTKKKHFPASLIFKDGRSLRDYQEEGLSWLDDKYENGVSCILADEMGLGKTIQSVAMLETLRIKRGIHGPFLVVAPVSTLGHWQREVESLTDMNCVVYSGTQEDREIIREYEFTYDGADSSGIKFNILLTSFEILMKDQNKLAKISWQFVIVDEAHRLKSRESKTSLSLKQMEVPRGGLLLLTGTPVQNSTKELFSLLNLLDSELFASEDEFLAKYGDLRNAEQVKDLQDNVLRPRLLRRMKEDVEKTIPLKEETIVWVELTKQQWIYYRAILEKNIGTLLKGSSSSNVPNLRNVAMELRKVCNHPLLCDGVEEDLTRKLGAPMTGQSSAIGGADRNASLKLLQQSSGKMILVDKLLPMLKEAGSRVLIFSQFTMMLDLLEDYLNHKGYTYERIDGTIRGSDRQAAIDRYSADGSDIFVFLLSTRAGGLGITLTAADTCLIYDSDWNPQNDLQAMARCHRIGQTKDVRIYRLITSKTYEQKLFEVSSRKYGLDEAILGNRLGAAAVDVEQSINIETLLKNGAYDMMKDDGGAASDNFNTSNIHEILAHRTQTRSIGGRGVNTFSVATFISQSEMENEATDERKQKLGKGAEEFWQELLPDAVQKSKATVENKVVGTDTKRKRVRVDYREDLKHVSDDDTYENSSEQESQSDDGSGSEASDEGNGLDSWPEREVKRLEDRLMALGRNRSSQIQQEAKLEHRSLNQIEQVSEFLVQVCHYEVTRAARASKDSQAIQASRASAQVGQDAQASQVLPASHPDLSPKFTQATASQATEATPATSGTPDARPNGQMPSLGIKLPEGEQFGSGIRPIERESVPEILPKDTLLINDEESGVNYRKSGCFLIGDTRRPSAPACIRKAMKSKATVDRLAKNASRYLQTLQEREILAFAIAIKDARNFPPKVPIRSKKIPSWWGEQEDRDFLIGVNRHGHREFKKVRADPNLCFAKRINAPRPATPQSVPQVAGYPGQPPVYHMQPGGYSHPAFVAEQRSYPMQHATYSGHEAHGHPGQLPYQGQPAYPGQFGYPGHPAAYPGHPPYLGQPPLPYPGQPPAYPGQSGVSAQLGHPNPNPNPSLSPTVDTGDDWPADLVLQSRLKKLIQMLPKQNGPELCELSKYNELNSKTEKKSAPADLRENTEKSESVTVGSSVKETPREAAIRRVKLEVEKLRCKPEAPMSTTVMRDVCLKGQ